MVLLSYLFYESCISGSVDDVKKYYDMISNIQNASEYLSCIFQKICLNNRLDVAKWLYGTGSISVNDVDTSYDLVCNNQIEPMIFWLASLGVVEQYKITGMLWASTGRSVS